jgi:hypothetical protein
VRRARPPPVDDDGRGGASGSRGSRLHAAPEELRGRSRRVLAGSGRGQARRRARRGGGGRAREWVSRAHPGCQLIARRQRQGPSFPPAVRLSV